MRICSLKSLIKGKGLQFFYQPYYPLITNSLWIFLEIAKFFLSSIVKNVSQKALFAYYLNFNTCFGHEKFEKTTLNDFIFKDTSCLAFGLRYSAIIHHPHFITNTQILLFWVNFHSPCV